MGITGIIPAYNDEANIHDIIKKAGVYVDNIVVVDDGSTDSTAYVAEKMSAYVIRHEAHKGKMESLKAAFKFSERFGKGPVLVINPGQLYNTEEIPKMLDPVMWLEADAVVGYSPYPSNGGPQYDIQSLITDNNGNGNGNGNGSDPGRQQFTKFLYDNIGYAAFSAQSANFMKFEPDSLPMELSLIKDISDAGMRIKEMNVSKLQKEDTDILHKYKIGVVIPAYNEEKLISTTVDGIPDYVNRIYVINDASTDNTAEVLNSIDDPRLSVIDHKENQGVGAAILHGYKRALQEDMDITVVMGGDNQMNPALMPNLLMPIIRGEADYTKGNRLKSEEFRGGMSSWRLFGNSILTLLTKISSGYWNVMDPQNGYTAISKHALSNIDIDHLYTYYGYCNDMLVKLNTFGFRTIDISMPAHYGNEKSSIKYGRYMTKVSTMLLKKFLWRLKMKYSIQSFHPLVFFYAFGMIFLPVGALLTLYTLAATFIAGWPVPPSLPLIDALFIVAGLQFLLFAMLFDMRECNKTMDVSI
ncbi:glycosyltransferase family 2 protein [Methanolobus halotolerans]|uniref:Glycosyltransferase family 2 protein n=1 Tax=Methanolobus halotolerans TaxID=2052935 RepID=A0A4E0PWL7_9EURY|nr:glycosyltransferase [Methanolobus halotolerans]TGC06942.1 glycosyltransferase family 2 protein [Methanolobus halotolerans]